ncbi:MAG: 5-(carboxyamino)imidazole ribonucleotide mutase [Deltaproteobacteria bacterium]|jgi:phosphoribosylaminoimidazole carboxylase PurE protein|nr:5-(carboxyamino)imidazole ribonucleotide mutase [Deltaproteobacteria bacterium]
MSEEGRPGPRVGVVMGSESDRPVMGVAGEVLNSLGVPFEIRVASAHRTPERTLDYARAAEGRGLKVIICGAGMSAHLAGVVASSTVLPVVGVPLSGASPLGGMEALLSTVQMPSGVPVATVAINGAKNAAWLAARILALGDPELASRVKAAREAAAAAAAVADAVDGRLK